MVKRIFGGVNRSEDDVIHAFRQTLYKLNLELRWVRGDFITSYVLDRYTKEYKDK